MDEILARTEFRGFNVRLKLQPPKVEKCGNKHLIAARVGRVLRGAESARLYRHIGTAKELDIGTAKELGISEFLFSERVWNREVSV
jgi:hypothetical protein